MGGSFVLSTGLHFCLSDRVDRFSDRYEEFQGIGADIIGVSTDSVYSHRAWIKTPRDKGGVEGLIYPLAADATKNVSRDYGVLIEDRGIALARTLHHRPGRHSALQGRSRSEHRTFG